MMDRDAEDQLIREIGGRFRLTVLTQKRMVELLGQSPIKALVKVEGDRTNLRAVVIAEIRQGKIQLAPREDPDPLEDVEKRETAPTTDAEPIEDVFGLEIKKIKGQRIEEMARLFELRKSLPDAQGECASPSRKRTEL